MKAKKYTLINKSEIMKNLLLLSLMAFTLIQGAAQNWNQNYSTSDVNPSNVSPGQALSISGNYAIIGTPFEDEDANETNTLTDAGSAYLFELDACGQWTEVQKIVAADRSANDMFGQSVSISGNFAIIGAFAGDKGIAEGNKMTDAGCAYIFERNEMGIWNEVQKIVASDRSFYDLFGYTVSISGNNAIIGAFAGDKDITEGNLLADAGSAYIFERSKNGNWKEVQKLVASDRASEDWFGYTVTISKNYLVVGSIAKDKGTKGLINKDCEGSEYIFEKQACGRWKEMDRIVIQDENLLTGLDELYSSITFVQ
jgi:FG-GAP repeat